MTIQISPHDPEEHVEMFLAAAEELLDAGCTTVDVQLASLRAHFYLMLREFMDPDGSVSAEVFAKLERVIIRTVTEELQCMLESSVVRRRPKAPVLTLVPKKQRRAIINVGTYT